LLGCPNSKFRSLQVLRNRHTWPPFLTFFCVMLCWVLFQPDIGKAMAMFGQMFQLHPGKALDPEHCFIVCVDPIGNGLRPLAPSEPASVHVYLLRRMLAVIPVMVVVATAAVITVVVIMVVVIMVVVIMAVVMVAHILVVAAIVVDISAAVRTSAVVGATPSTT
jgi:hypothetical protein